MLFKSSVGATLGAFALSTASVAAAVDLEVTHWWTSGGEAAALAELARAFNESTDHNWLDGAIAGSSGVARPMMISRILGGDPMGATQFNHGRQTEELIDAGLMLDLTELAEKEGWKDLVNPSSLLDSCTHKDKIYCVPVNIHSWQWFWLSHQAFEDAGVDIPTNWYEFVEAAPALREAGIVPLAKGGQPWQSNGTFSVLAIAIAGIDAWRGVYNNKNPEVAAGAEFAKVFEAAAAARELAKGSNVQDWNLATNMVITGKAGGQIMGDWAQGEFQVAGQKAGRDYTCLPGLGVNKIISTGGDAFYFPKNKDAEIEAAQLELASLLLSKEVQVSFNLKKGSLPVRGDIDMEAANDCMNLGLDILASGNILPDGNQTLSPDTTGQLEDLMVEFWASDDISPAQAQKRFAEIIDEAD